jgi:hypothetical protein
MSKGQRATPSERPCDGQLIGILEVRAGWQAVGQPGDPNPSGPQPLREVVGCCIPLHIWIGGNHHLLDALGVDSVLQFGDPQLVGTDSIDGRQNTLQHVIEAAKFTATLDGQDIERLFDNTELSRIPSWIGTDRT